MFFCDTESDGFKFESSRVWILCSLSESGELALSYDYKESKKFSDVLPEWTPQEAKVFKTHTEHLRYLEADGVCFHNYFQHDKPLIRKFLKDWSPKREEDTYILSQLFNPDRGFHGLEDWGNHLGISKPEYTDWMGGLTKEMIHRCIEDVKITQAVYLELKKERDEWDWERSISLEYAIADIQGRQEMMGVLFDLDRATELAEWIYSELNSIDEVLTKDIPMRVIQGDVIEAPFNKSGEVSLRVKNWFSKGEIV